MSTELSSLAVEDMEDQMDIDTEIFEPQLHVVKSRHTPRIYAWTQAARQIQEDIVRVGGTFTVSF